MLALVLRESLLVQQEDPFRLTVKLAAALLVALAVALFQQARTRTRQAEILARQLEAEAAERRRAETSSSEQARMLRSVLNSLGEGIVASNEAGDLVQLNPVAEALLGLGIVPGPPATWPASYGMFMPDRTTPMPLDLVPLERARRGQVVDGFDVFIRHAGRPAGVLVRCNARPILDAEGTPRGSVCAFRDVGAQRHAEEEMRRTHEALQHAVEGIARLDAAGRHITVNAAYGALLGREPEDLLGGGWEAVVHAEDRAAVAAAHAQMASAGRAQVEARGLRGDGSDCWLDLILVRDLDGRGAFAGSFCFVRDVSERRTVGRLKDEFVSVVSHELRTPLTAIRGSLGLIATGVLGTLLPKGQRLLEIAVSNTDRLIRLINDILDIERIDSGQVPMDLQLVEAGDLLRQVGDLMRPLTAQAGVHLVMEPTAARLWADADRVVQALTNLVGNAVKFSPRDRTVRVSTRREADQLVFQVHDEGRGIPKDKLERIFERFQQVDSSDARSKGGTGLGLAIGRVIAVQHGGRLWAESVLGVGSTFSLALPIALVRPASSPPGPPGAAPRAGVLIAEDDADLGQVLAELLAGCGLPVRRAGTGSEVMRLIKDQAPAVLVLDVFMPEGSGFEVVDWMRQDRQARGVSLVIYTALDLQPAERARLDLGRTAFLIKGRSSLADLERQVLAFLSPRAVPDTIEG